MCAEQRWIERIVLDACAFLGAGATEKPDHTRWNAVMLLVRSSLVCCLFSILCCFYASIVQYSKRSDAWACARTFTFSRLHCVWRYCMCVCVCIMFIFRLVHCNFFPRSYVYIHLFFSFPFSFFVLSVVFVCMRILCSTLSWVELLISTLVKTTTVWSSLSRFSWIRIRLLPPQCRHQSSPSIWMWKPNRLEFNRIFWPSKHAKIR